MPLNLTSISNPNFRFYQGLAKGTNISPIGTVQITWHTGAPQQNGTSNATTPAKSTPPTTTPAHTNLKNGNVAPHPPLDEDIDVHPREEDHEEELGASGWGGDDGDEGYGMM